MDSGLNEGGDAAGEGDEPAFDLGETLAGIAEERGDKLGDGAPPPPEAAPATPPPPAPATSPAPAEPVGRRPPDLERAPSAWKPEVAGKWANLDPEIRAEIHRREEDSARGVAEVKQRADVGTRFDQTIAPYRDELARFNVDPFVLTQNLMAAHHTLAMGSPQQKGALLRQLARDYQIPLGEQPLAEEGWVDPQVKALQEEVQLLKSGLESQTRTQAEARRAEITRDVTAFASDPANPHFDAVQEEIADLIRASGGKLSLKEAYGKAVWMNPQVREALLADKASSNAEAAKRAEAERAAASAKARGLNVRSTSKPVADTGKTGSMEDTLKETLAVINGRDK